LTSVRHCLILWVGDQQMKSIGCFAVMAMILGIGGSSLNANADSTNTNSDDEAFKKSVMYTPEAPTAGAAATPVKEFFTEHPSLPVLDHEEAFCDHGNSCEKPMNIVAGTPPEEGSKDGSKGSNPPKTSRARKGPLHCDKYVAEIKPAQPFNVATFCAQKRVGMTDFVQGFAQCTIGKVPVKALLTCSRVDCLGGADFCSRGKVSRIEYKAIRNARYVIKNLKTKPVEGGNPQEITDKPAGSAVTH
jgi:hypothetical protein